MSEEKEGKLKNYALAISLALSTILGAIQVSDWLQQPRAELSARVEFGEFALPKGINDQFRELQSVASFPELKEGIKLTEQARYYFAWKEEVLASVLSKKEAGLSPDAARILSELEAEIRHLDVQSVDGMLSALKSFAEYLNRALPSELPEQFQNLKGYWRIQVTNDGDIAAKDIFLKLPYSKFILIRRDGSPDVTKEIDGVIEFEQLGQKGMLNIYAWASVPIIQKDTENLVLAHAAGLGDINVYSPGPPFKKIADILLVIGLGLIGSALVAGLLDRLERWRRFSSVSKMATGKGKQT